jgi:hypothetical protein
LEKGDKKPWFNSAIVGNEIVKMDIQRQTLPGVSTESRAKHSIGKTSSFELARSQSEWKLQTTYEYHFSGLPHRSG